MTPYKNAQSSVAKWGGSPEDYIELHDWFDETKMFTGDWTHRALRHHSAGIQWAIQKFGHAIQISTGHAIPTKLIAEQHITEDCGFIPTPAHYLSPLAKHPEKWMPLYSRVTFSLQPYAEALAIGDFQNAIMQEVLKIDNIEEIWNSERVENRILELLEQN